MRICFAEFAIPGNDAIEAIVTSYAKEILQQRLEKQKSAAGKGATGTTTNLFRGWRLLEVFVVIQFLFGALTLVPALQSVRMIIRATPYLSSIGLLFYYWYVAAKDKDSAEKLAGSQRHPARPWLILVIALYLVNYYHPNTHYKAGIAQIMLQICIVAPLFWAHLCVRREGDLLRLVWLIFACSLCSAAAGLLQTYWPDIFMPAAFTSVDPEIVARLSYVGADGKLIIRPPGLSDTPGGAAVAAMSVAFLGIVLTTDPLVKWSRRILFIAAASCGMFVLYLTQVRSLFLMMLVAILAMAFLLWKQKRRLQSTVLLALCGSMVVLVFTWAITVGGASVADRFLGLAEEGVVKSYQENRGDFLLHTFNVLLPEYPLGAGLGRWGMMQVYFNKSTLGDSAPLWAEIQLQGWLYDGGVLMWLFYGGAIFASLWHTYRIGRIKERPVLSYYANIALCFQLLLVGQSLAGPIFNTQAGIQFWLLAAAVHGVAWHEGLLTKSRTSYKTRPQFKGSTTALPHPKAHSPKGHQPAFRRSPHAS